MRIIDWSQTCALPILVSTQKMEPPRLERLLNVFAGFGRTLVKYWRGLMRGNIIGTAIGILPGAGGDIAAWVTYALSKKMSKEPEKFGTGHVEGVVDAGATNKDRKSTRLNSSH